MGMAAEKARNEDPIKTVVVLVQENRSFDHMLGWMKTLNPEINGVTGKESNPKSTSDPNSERLYFTDKATNVSPDPGHSFQAIYEQIFGVPWNKDKNDGNSPDDVVVTMEGFAQNAEGTSEGLSGSVMSGFRPEAVPVYEELVREFGVCDRWFAAVPASTQPNRLYVHSATSYGAMSNDRKSLAVGFPQKTVFESMEESGFSFGIYFQSLPSTLFYRNLRKLKYIERFHQFDLEFEKHSKEGKLPNYVVIEPKYFENKLIKGNDDHPPHDISRGQKLVKQVYEALRSSPQWNEILFIITYDEHGGFYDHVPTPTAIPNPDGKVGSDPYNFQFNRLGVRVPTILISPWIERGTVLHGPSGPYPTSEFEHSSIPATLKKIFNLKEFLTKRDAWAGTFEVVLNRTNPRTDCPVSLLEPAKMQTLEEVKEQKFEETEVAKLSEFQMELVQLAAVLRGDHLKNDFLDNIVEKMTIFEATDYVGDAFKRFLSECEDAIKKGADESFIVCCADNKSKRNPSKSFSKKLFSCLTCHLNEG